MKKTFLKNLPFLLAGVCLLFLPASFAFAADTGNGFVALAPIPGVTDASASNFGAFFNSLFRLLIVGAGILAVIRIGWAGIVYMTTESTHGKGEAKEKIEDAVIGLLLALGTFLILSIINPNLTLIGGISTIRVAGDNFPQQVNFSRPATQADLQTLSDLTGNVTSGGASTGTAGYQKLACVAQGNPSGFQITNEANQIPAPPKGGCPDGGVFRKQKIMSSDPKYNEHVLYGCVTPELLSTFKGCASN